jgi:hypothetical protein
MKEWIKELCPVIADWQAEMIAEAAVAAVAAEREECAKVAEQFEPDEKTSYVYYASQAIRAREQG